MSYWTMWTVKDIHRAADGHQTVIPHLMRELKSTPSLCFSSRLKAGMTMLRDGV